MTHTTTDAAEARAREVLARAMASKHWGGLVREGKDGNWHVIKPSEAIVAMLAFATAEAASGAGEREESWTGDPHRVSAELRRVASKWKPGFRLPQLLRDAADEIDCLSTHASLPPATDPTMVMLPPEIAAHILKIGRVEWGQTHAHVADGHGEHIARSVRLTAEAFGQKGDQHMHGLWLEGTETVVAHTGTSPNAPATTQALVGMWNWFHDQAALADAPTIPATGEAGQ